MANFRRNHDKASGGGLLSKSMVFAVILGGLLYFFNAFQGEEEMGEIPSRNTPDQEGGQRVEIDLSESDYVLPTDFFPSTNLGYIIKHNYYALSYSEKHEQPEWVAYELTKESIRVPNVPRPNNFRPDPKVRKSSAVKADYRGSGYDRGHLVPSGDMAFNERAISETFYLSNMSPQIRNFNSGIWRELEERVRDWAWDNKHLYVITGPVLTRDIRETIGPNEVAVPEEYYKVILDYTQPGLKGIAFIMPNEISTRALMDYAVTIDEIEKITGLDFFPEIPDEDEERLESKIDKTGWRIDRNQERARIHRMEELDR
ncbi:MAG: DNA/RNA non-specific endonuclease [Bacteroidota bacterium]